MTLPLILLAPTGIDSDAVAWLQYRDALQYLGYIHFLQGTFKEADIQTLAGFLKRYPNTVYSPYASFGLGQMHFYRKRYAEAIELFKRLAEEHPEASVWVRDGDGYKLVPTAGQAGTVDRAH
jgi:TolA-binding protein